MGEHNTTLQLYRRARRTTLEKSSIKHLGRSARDAGTSAGAVRSEWPEMLRLSLPPSCFAPRARLA